MTRRVQAFFIVHTNNDEKMFTKVTPLNYCFIQGNDQTTFRVWITKSDTGLTNSGTRGDC